MSITYSLIIPVYKNRESLPRLLEAVAFINSELKGEMEAVFVVDGSPDRCLDLLFEALPGMPFPAQVLGHSRNFGSMAAIRSGLKAARGRYSAVMAADLQEPPELVLRCFSALAADECDVAVGTRNSRHDPLFSRLASSVFWGLYRRYVVPEMPSGGVDIFACNAAFRERLLTLEESRSSLIALIFWLGYRRKLIGYDRLERQEGKSAWTLRKKLDYMMDSIFAFSDLPIRLLLRIGCAGMAAAFVLGLVVLWAKATGSIEVPGYAATMLAILLLGALNLFALGLVGVYAWRAYENTKRRPQAVVAVTKNNENSPAE